MFSTFSVFFDGGSVRENFFALKTKKLALKTVNNF